MDFQTLHSRLIAALKARVRGGEVTERGLARIIGVSQPHIHNVLKGARSLSLELADHILRKLQIDFWELAGQSDSPLFTEIPLLEGRIGPGHPFPVRKSADERYPFRAADLAALISPVAARVADDPLMRHLFRANDILLLDRCERKRGAPEPEAYYVIEQDGEGMVRAGCCISPANRNILEVVKARVVWIGRYMEPTIGPPIEKGPPQETR